MRWMERVKHMIRSWLEIQPAAGRGLTIQEPVSHATNVLRNRVWYRGDASELDQLFKLLGDDAVGQARFWAAAPQNETIRKAHSGLPGIMVDTLAGVVKSDLSDLDFDKNQEAAARWQRIAEENRLPDLVSQAVADTLVTGDGAFKISLDTQVSAGPILEFWGADRVEYVRRHGRICAVHFLSPIGDRGRMLKEIYEPGSVRYALLDGDKEIPLDGQEEYADLKPVTFDGDFLLAVPLQFWPSARWNGRGQSIFDKKTDAFDAHDEIISQWLDAVRAGRVQKYIPESLIPRGEDGTLRNVNSFGTQFVKLETDNRESAENRIDTVQPEIRYEAFVASYTSTLNMCLQGIMSPATLGIDVGKMSSAEAQREKKDITGMTRNAITDALEAALPQLAQAALAAADILEDKAPGEYKATVSFGEYGAPDFDSRVDTIARAATGSIMSVEAQVDELWGSSKGDDWKQAEVRRIREERGILEMDEPSVGDEAGAVITGFRAPDTR